MAINKREREPQLHNSALRLNFCFYCLLSLSLSLRFFRSDRQRSSPILLNIPPLLFLQSLSICLSRSLSLSVSVGFLSFGCHRSHSLSLAYVERISSSSSSSSLIPKFVCNDFLFFVSSMAEEGGGGGGGGDGAPVTAARRVLLISAGASHSVALLCKLLQI